MHSLIARMPINKRFMNTNDDFKPFRQALATWYQSNKRDLPWRHTTDPYIIWISEIILQQTQVVQGLGYFNRFIERFPNVKSLAEAPLDEVLKLWQGLGYYSRARNLHASAQQIMIQFHGEFPTEHAQVLSLKGIGEYTAAAICSFAYQQPFATIDGNVYRVLARYFGIDTPIDSTEGKKLFSVLATELLDREHPDTHNQAMMEFGALQCTPSSPNCDACPLQNSCIAYNHKRITELPKKTGKTSVRARYFNYIFMNLDTKTYLHQRGPKDIWQGLYEFPLIETTQATNVEELLKSEPFQTLTDGQSFTILGTSPTKKHVLSHQHIFAQCIHIQLDKKATALNQYTEIDLKNLHDYPTSRLMELFLELK